MTSNKTDVPFVHLLDRGDSSPLSLKRSKLLHSIASKGGNESPLSKYLGCATIIAKDHPDSSHSVCNNAVALRRNTWEEQSS